MWAGDAPKGNPTRAKKCKKTWTGGKTKKGGKTNKNNKNGVRTSMIAGETE